AAAQHQHVDDAAVVHVAVVPVVHRRADDHHGLAAGLVGVVGELARHGDGLVTRHAGDLLLPGRRVGHVVVVAVGDILVFQTARHAVVGGDQIEHGGDHRLARGELDGTHRDLAHQHLFLRVGGEVG